MIQQIIQFIGNNLFIVFIVVVGLFNFSVRMAQKMREQRVKREAHLERQRQQQEFMRTGKSPAAASPQAPVVDEKAQRRERIEQLRQERMEQLRALREKRASVSGPAAPPAQAQRTPVPAKPARPVRQSASPSGQRQPMPPQAPRPNQSQPKSKPQLRPVQPTLTPAQQAQQDLLRSFTQQRQSQSAQTDPTDRRSRSRRVASSEQANSAKDPEARVAGQLEKTRKSTSRNTNTASMQGMSAKSMLRNRSSLRQALVLREVLDTPIALRDQDVASGSLYS